MRKILLLILLLISTSAFAEDVVSYSRTTYQGCRSIGDTNVFLTNPNDYATVKPGFIYLPNGCKSLPNVSEKYLKISNGAVVEMSAGEKTTVDNNELAQALATLRQGAKDHIVADSVEAKAMRNAFRVVMGSLLETRQKVNQLVSAQNSAHGTNIATLTNRTWQDVLTATRNQIDAETDANN